MEGRGHRKLVPRIPGYKRCDGDSFRRNCIAFGKLSAYDPVKPRPGRHRVLERSALGLKQLLPTRACRKIRLFNRRIRSSAPLRRKKPRDSAKRNVLKIPLLKGDTKTGTLFAFGFNPDISIWSPYHGAMYAVLESFAKLRLQVEMSPA